MLKNLLIVMVVSALVGYGSARLGNPSGQTTITANNNTIISLGAGHVALTTDAFRAIVTAAVTDKK